MLNGMNYRGVLISLVFVGSCGSEAEPETTGAIMEFEHVDPSYDMQEQPEIIQKFFLLDPDFIGDDFCYDHDEVQSVLLADIIETSEMSTWDLFGLSNSNKYLGLENTECQVTIEFKTFIFGGKTCAYLNQVNRGGQRFDYLELDPKKNRWSTAGVLPGPSLVDYFDDLNEDEKKLVDENGVQFVYLSETSDTLHYFFSIWEMARRMDAEDTGFNKEPNSHFILTIQEEDFLLEKVIDNGD
ncbi:hypothetical protein JYT74_00175 [Crocinitomix catalasitica]|nr:hypothetical protein [Crocinitomix catalasitica]